MEKITNPIDQGIIRIGKDCHWGEETKFGYGVSLGNRIRIGKNVLIGNNVTIFDNVNIGDGTIIENNCMLGYGNLTSKRDDELSSVTEIGIGVIVRCNSVVYRGCRLGEKVIINHNVCLREGTIIGHHSRIGSGTCAEGNLVIGSYVGIHSQCHLTAHMKIGDYVFIAPFFLPTNDPLVVYKRSAIKERLAQEGKEKERGPVIKFGARIAGNVLILPEKVIGREAFIGAGAIVTKDVPDYGIVVSMGARGEYIKDVPTRERLREGIDFQRSDLTEPFD